MSDLYLIRCPDGRWISLGKAPAERLEAEGRIRRLNRHHWRSVDWSLEEINGWTFSFPEFRECDFCSGLPSPWRIPTTEFVLSFGVHAGAKLGGPFRPVVCCAECERYVKVSSRRLLLHALDAQYQRTRRLPQTRHLTRKQVIETIHPIVADIVAGTFAHKTGPPEPYD